MGDWELLTISFKLVQVFLLRFFESTVPVISVLAEAGSDSFLDLGLFRGLFFVSNKLLLVPTSGVAGAGDLGIDSLSILFSTVTSRAEEALSMSPLQGSVTTFSRVVGAHELSLVDVSVKCVILAEEAEETKFAGIKILTLGFRAGFSFGGQIRFMCPRRVPLLTV